MPRISCHSSAYVVIEQAIDTALGTWQRGCIYWGLREEGGKYVCVFHMIFL